jgi:hypothetical protein
MGGKLCKVLKISVGRKKNEQEISKAQVLVCSIPKQKRIEKRSGESFLEPSKQGSYPVAAAKENRME